MWRTAEQNAEQSREQSISQKINGDAIASILMRANFGATTGAPGLGIYGVMVSNLILNISILIGSVNYSPGNFVYCEFCQHVH